MQATHQRRLIQAVLAIAIGLYFFFDADRNWISHDEGLLAQSAERVLLGDWPHIDFDDPYTGGQALFHAVAMKCLAVNLYSLRIAVGLAMIVGVLLVFSLAMRFTSPLGAAAVSLLSALWSLPNYFAGMPSWYNLVFALASIWALVHYEESNRRRWLFLAGLLTGLSFLFKLSAIYAIAATLLYLVYRNQGRECDSTGLRRSWGYFAFCMVCLGAFVGLLGLLIRKRMTVEDSAHFVFPGLVLSLFLLVQEFRLGRGALWSRMSPLLHEAILFAIGFLFPVSLFLIPYLLRFQMDLWIAGVFVLPQKRIQWTDYAMPSIDTIGWMVPWAVLMLVTSTVRIRWDRYWVVAIVGMLALVGVLYGSSEPVYSHLWHSIRWTIPLLSLLVCFNLAIPTGAAIAPANARLTFLIMAYAAMLSLIQFPYSFGIYSCYVAPLVVLAWLAWLSCCPGPPIRIHLVLLLFLAAFAIAWMNRSHIRALGVKYLADGATTSVDLPRFGLRVNPSQAKLYTDVVREVQKHSREGDYIFATADCPEIYFLSGRRNPSRTFYDFFDRDFDGEPSIRIQRILKMLEDQRVDVVVFYWEAEFSGQPRLELAEAISSRYPQVRHLFRSREAEAAGVPSFSVAWRERPSQE